ncbi:MAG: hypothetical protein MUO58_17035, partial [Anaerolineales bacterium]|nr:hypothetical protein [Anaerolineales bacterium]
MLDRLRKFYSPPYFEDDENLSFSAIALNYSLLGTGTLFGSYLTFILIFFPGLYPRLPLIAAIFPFILFSRWLMHQRRVRLAGLIFVLSLFGEVALLAVNNGGVHAPSFNGLFLVVLASYFLLDFRASVVLALLTLITGSGCIIAEGYGWISPISQTPTSESFITAHLIYLLGPLALLYLTTHIVDRSKAQTQHAHNLKEEAQTAQRQSDIRYRAILDDQTEFINRFTLDGTV